MLEIKNLTVRVDDKTILDGLNLTVKTGEVAAIMGPNGSGKSTLSYVVAGRPDYEVLDGEVLLNGENILAMEPDERAAAGVFLAFQYPIEIPGVATMTFLRTAVNAQRKARAGKDDPIPVKQFRTEILAAMERLKVPRELASRYLNEGFSGGEKKRVEILQMALLQPKIAILDETDSGLDIDALNTVAEGVNAVAGETGMGTLIITHYQRILHIVKPEFVHIMFEGRIVKEGGPELVTALEERGYGWIREEVAAAA